MAWQSTRVINGVGKPRLIVLADVQYMSTGATTYTATDVTEAGTPALVAAGVKIGQRISSFQVISGQPNKPIYGKITNIDDVTDKISVDAWKGGTPTNGQAFTVDGFVIDLPRCQEMTEIFGPDYLLHPLYGGDEGTKEETKFQGWEYRCVLDYSKFSTGDMLVDLQPALNRKSGDRLILVPRVDAAEFQYNVRFVDAISLSKYGRSAGYRKPVFVFKSKENLASWPIQSGYGYGYAQAYGTQL